MDINTDGWLMSLGASMSKITALASGVKTITIGADNKSLDFTLNDEQASKINIVIPYPDFINSLSVKDNQIYYNNIKLETVKDITTALNNYYTKNEVDNTFLKLTNVVAGDNITITKDTTEKTITIKSVTNGTFNYNELNNKPKINNITITGNVTNDEIGVLDKDTFNTHVNNKDAHVTAKKQKEWDNKVDKDGTKVLSDKNFTEEYEEKLNGISENADANEINAIKVNDIIIPTDDDKIVNIAMPTKTSDLTNDSNFVVDSELNDYILNPAIDGAENQVLSIDGDGNKYWKTLSGGADLSSISQNISPLTASTYDIGTEVKPFKAIYADEVHVSSNTLYVNGTPVLGSSDNTINLYADKDQDVKMKTTGSGNSQIISENNIEVVSSGDGGSVNIKSTGLGGKH